MNILNIYNYIKKQITPVRLIVSSFLGLIFIGTIILCLPICAKNNETTNLLDSFFISTSCSCVTGLTPFDTYTHWSGFGQAIILFLILLGWLGPVSFMSGFSLLIRRKLGVKNIQLAQEYTRGNAIDIPMLLKTILFVSFLFELCGTLLLSFRFIPLYGLKGIWISIFLSVSAYCNAGFDIMGFLGPDQSLIAFQDDIYTSLVISFLIIFGGIGFLVVTDIYSKFMYKFKKTDFHPHFTINTYIVVLTTLILLIFGTIGFFILEKDHSLSQLSLEKKIVASFFQSTTSRTAGFFTVNPANQIPLTKMLIIILMFIGASPSSTGGGIKTTTIFVLIATVFSALKSQDDTTIRKHRLKKNIVYQAITITILALTVIFLVTIILEIVEFKKNISTIDIIYESISAFSTVGLSTGITFNLSAVSKITLCLAMFIGRVGPISLIISLLIKSGNKSKIVLPEGKILVG